MFPQFDTTIDITTPSEEPKTGRVFLFDFTSKQYVLSDGKAVEATYEQSIQQWLTKVLITEIDKYEIYKDTGFGMSILQFIGRRDLPVGVVNSEVKRQLEEKIIDRPEIVSVEDFATAREGSEVFISFNVVTAKGSSVGFGASLSG